MHACGFLVIMFTVPLCPACTHARAGLGPALSPAEQLSLDRLSWGGASSAGTGAGARLCLAAISAVGVVQYGCGTVLRLAAQTWHPLRPASSGFDHRTCAFQPQALLPSVVACSGPVMCDVGGEEGGVVASLRRQLEAERAARMQVEKVRGVLGMPYELTVTMTCNRVIRGVTGAKSMAGM